MGIAEYYLKTKRKNSKLKQNYKGIITDEGASWYWNWII